MRGHRQVFNAFASGFLIEAAHDAAIGTSGIDVLNANANPALETWLLERLLRPAPLIC
jgi:hypothetical protein